MSFPLKNVRLLATNLFKEGVTYHARVGETRGALPEFVLVGDRLYDEGKPTVLASHFDIQNSPSTVACILESEQQSPPAFFPLPTSKGLKLIIS